MTQAEHKVPLVYLAPYGPDFWREAVAASRPGRLRLCLSLGDDSDIRGLARKALQQCPPRFCIAGFCLAGAVAIEMLQCAGDRMCGVALVNASVEPDSRAQREARTERIVKLRARAQAGLEYPDVSYIRHAARWLVAPQAAGAEERAAEVLAAVPAHRSLAHQLALLSRPDFRATLRAGSVPMLAVSGAHDRLCRPITVNDLSADARHSTYLLERCGHLSPLERPRTLARILEAWLERVDAFEEKKERSDEFSH